MAPPLSTCSTSIGVYQFRHSHTIYLGPSDELLTFVLITVLFRVRDSQNGVTFLADHIREVDLSQAKGSLETFEFPLSTIQFLRLHFRSGYHKDFGQTLGEFLLRDIKGDDKELIASFRGSDDHL